jgi:NADH-dependent peroxiredoxin subunit F
MYDLIVVGGGPAGLTAAVYALRKRLDVLLISKDLGGKTNFRLGLPWIEDYQVIKGLEIVNKFKSELEYLDFARRMEPVECISRHEDESGPYFSIHMKGGDVLEARAVIVATGVRQQRLEVPGERDYIMKGLCYSAVSYAPLFIDKKTVVVGDGDLALRAAAELETVAQHVTLLREESTPMASPLYQKLQNSPKVTILEGCQVTAVRGDAYANTLILKDAGGAESVLNAEGTFIEKALSPNTKMVEGLVDFDELGRIKVDNHARTSQPGIFAAGDVTDSYAEQVLVAVGEGAKAALSAYEYLLPVLEL